jgi:glyoxylase-like metal-dependent hydrolase (beta-lactamase superfamily II)
VSTGEAEQDWDEQVDRVLAPNPSPMTLEGTNTYVVAAPGARTAVVIDPGPAGDEHALRVMRATRGRQVELVLLTHGHWDHAESARAFADTTGAPLAAVDPGLATPGAPALADGSVLRAGGTELTCVATPGHTPDSVSFLLNGRDAIFTGDHVLGRGTSVVMWPEGDMVAYLDSLERVLATGAGRIFPGHGPLVGDARATVTGYLAHRREREAQILAAVAAGDRTAAEVVARVYAEVDPVLHRPAEKSVRAHVVKLLAEGRLAGDVEGFTTAVS